MPTILKSWYHPDLIVMGIVTLLVFAILLDWILRKTGRLEVNFLGNRIPQSYGLLILLWSCAMLSVYSSRYSEHSLMASRWLLCIGGFGTLGLIDDIWGDKKVKGLRGHFRAAFKTHRITTGFLKATGGFAIALWLGYTVNPSNLILALLSGILIALCANAFNLLDLRPGRSSAIFLLCSAFLLCYILYSGSIFQSLPFIIVVIPTLVVWFRDSRAQVMMGDTGSNLIGATLGFAIVTWTSLLVQCIALVLLLGLHLLAERFSITALIQKQPVLRFLDRLTGVR